MTQDARSAPATIDKKWIAIFEQSYGTEGLYVIELHPVDVGGNARLNLQTLNGAAALFAVDSPKQAISFEILEKENKFPTLLPTPGVEYKYDEKSKFFVTNIGKDHSSLFGTALLVDGNRRIRQRLVEPDVYTRSRWKKIYADADAPDALRKEIELREFIIDQYGNPDVRIADKVQRSLAQIRAVADIYAINHGMKPGDEISVDTLMSAGLLGVMTEIPATVSIEYRHLGTDPVATFNGYTITPEPDSVTSIRKKFAQESLKKFGRYPPALALAARFEEPNTSVRMITQAIEIWPEVAGLRVERMTHEARRHNFAAWDQDLDLIITKFPAAPLLTEVQIAAENANLGLDADLEARVAVALADIRPDLLTQQLYALQVLKKTHNLGDAIRIYDRLLFANPAWKLIVPSPVKTMTPADPGSP